MPSIRQAKVGEMIKRELAEILLRDMRDPRIASLMVTGVDVARDLSIAKVYVSSYGEESERAAALKAIQGAAGYLRGQLARRIELRTVPTLAFRYDTGIERGTRINELLRQEREELGLSDEEVAGAVAAGTTIVPEETAVVPAAAVPAAEDAA